MQDRTIYSRDLAKALAFRQAGNIEQARVHAANLLAAFLTDNLLVLRDVEDVVYAYKIKQGG